MLHGCSNGYAEDVEERHGYLTVQPNRRYPEHGHPLCEAFNRCRNRHLGVATVAPVPPVCVI